jgi:AraC-like DNA-binding protein
MNTIQSSLFTAAFTLCMFTAGLLSGRKTETGRSFAYFTSYLIIESAGFVLELLMAHPSTPLKALWLGLRMATSLLIAPCLWLAVNESLGSERPRLALLGRAERALLVGGVILTLPLMATAHLGVGFYSPDAQVTELHSRFIHATMLLVVVVFAWQVPFYLWRCRAALEQAGTSTTALDPRASAQSWIRVALVIVFAAWILGLLRTLHCAFMPSHQESVLFFAVTEVSVTVGAMYVLVRRAASFHVPPPVVPAFPAVHTAPARDADGAQGTSSRYAKSSLDDCARERIKSKLEAALGGQELYRDSLLSLRSLSQAIHENVHYVSQVMNQDLGASFYELVNRHRIERAKQLLVEFPDRAVLEVATFVGFNSKSTFNSAFRRNTGTTPGQYRSARTTPSTETA